MGLIEKTFEFSVAGNVGRALRTSTYKQWAGVGAGINTARNLINRHQTKKELMSKGVDRDEASRLAKKQHGSVAGAALKGAAVGTVARGGAKMLGLKANAADKQLANINSGVKSGVAPKPTTVTPANKPKPKSKPKKLTKLQQAESKAQVATDLNNANESRRTLGGRIAGALGLGSTSEKAAREGFAFNKTTNQWENPNTGETRRSTYRFSDISIYFDVETRSFSTAEARAERAERRKNKTLATTRRGHGRAYLVGGVPGVIGAAGTTELAREMYEKGYHQHDIKKAAQKRAAKRGAIAGAITGAVLGGSKNGLKGAAMNAISWSALGAGGAAMGAGKRVRKMHEKERVYRH